MKLIDIKYNTAYSRSDDLDMHRISMLYENPIRTQIHSDWITTAHTRMTAKEVAGALRALADYIAPPWYKRLFGFLNLNPPLLTKP